MVTVIAGREPESALRVFNTNSIRMETMMNTERKIQTATTVLMSFSLALLFSGIFTWLNFGFSVAWLKAWPFGFAVGWPLALVLPLLIAKPVRKVAVKLATAGS